MVPYCQRILKVSLPFEQCMSLVQKALKNTRTQIKQIETGERRGIVLANKPFSIWSWGEKIMILIEANGTQTIVRLLSKSAREDTRRDWGKNRRNVDAIEKTMHRLLSRQESLFSTGFSDEDTPYKVLDIAPNASRTEILEAYRQKVRLYHPDRLTGLAPELRQLAEERMKAINAAFYRLGGRGDKD